MVKSCIILKENRRGVNVAQVLKHFAQETVVTGFFGGFSGKYIVDELQTTSIPVKPVWVKETKKNTFLTLGSRGSYFSNGVNIYYASAQPLKLLSSACAGDATFGSFLSIWLKETDRIEDAL